MMQVESRPPSSGAAKLRALLERELGEDLEPFLTHPRPPRFVRANTLRTTPAALREQLHAYGVEARLHPGIEGALEINPEGERVVAEAWHRFLGHYVIQSLASMLPPLLLAPKPGERVLDLCAAPGSKTTQLAALMQGRGVLWANDVKMRRTRSLVNRIDAVGALNVAVLCREGRSLDTVGEPLFDAILADVPCSALGNRSNLESVARKGLPVPRSEIVRTQWALLRNAARLVRVGGRILYSTCSLMSAENEEVIDRALAELPLRLLQLPTIPGLRVQAGRTQSPEGSPLDPSLASTWRVTPWENPTQGFYVALLECTGSKPTVGLPRETSPPTPTLGLDDPRIASFIESIASTHGIDPSHFEGYRYIFRENKRTLYILSPEHRAVHAGTVRPGLVLAREDLRRWRLSHASARWLGPRIQRNRVELTRAQAARLSRGERLHLARPDTAHPVLATAEDGPFGVGIWEHDLRWKSGRPHHFPGGS